MADADLFAAYQEAVADRDAAGQAWADNTDPALSDDLLAAWLSASQLVDSRLSDLVNDIQPIDDSIGATDLGTESPLIATVPIKLTSSMGNSKPRMAIDSLDNIWMVWHSDRSGSDEIYVARYFGQCGVWSTSGQGGEELKVTNFGPEGRRAMNPNVAVGPDGQVHIAFQGQTEDGRWEIYYCHSTAGGSRFTVPIRITNSPGNALMPDIAVFVTSGQGAEGSATVVIIVWHDDRFGSFEIMSAQRVNGEWASSGQGRSDTRITQADGDSMFPRVESDTKGNVRVVYQDSRRGESNVGIYMSTFVGTSGTWDSSASGGSDRLVSNGPSGSFNPDIDIDKTGGISVAWHDLRNAQEDPEQHEEIYALYCPRLGHPSGAHYPPLQPNIEARLDADFEIVDGVGFKPIVATNSPEIYLSINAPNATFWRASNEDGQYSAWQEFRPNFDLETMLVPWTLNCVSGKKQVCVQVQDAEMVGFPICHDIDLALQPPDFQVEFFEDKDLTIPLARTPLDRPAARRGDVYIKLSTEVPQILPPTFEVVSRGQRLILNQETEPLDAGASDTVGIGSFVGGTVDISQEDNVSPAALAFSAAAGRTFRGRFSLKCHDGLLNVDGPARVIVKPMDVCGKISAGQQDLAEGLSVVEPPESNVVLPDLEGGNPSNELREIPTVPITDPDPDPDPDNNNAECISYISNPSSGLSILMGGFCGQCDCDSTGCYALVQTFSVTEGRTLASCTVVVVAGLPDSAIPGTNLPYPKSYYGDVVMEVGVVGQDGANFYVTSILHSFTVQVGGEGTKPTTVPFNPPVALSAGKYCILIRSTGKDRSRTIWVASNPFLGSQAGGAAAYLRSDIYAPAPFISTQHDPNNKYLPMKLSPFPTLDNPLGLEDEPLVAGDRVHTLALNWSGAECQETSTDSSCSPGTEFGMEPSDRAFLGKFGMYSNPGRPGYYAGGKWYPATSWTTNGRWYTSLAFSVSQRSYFMGCSLWTQGQDQLYAALVLIQDNKYKRELEGIVVDISSDGSSAVDIPFSGNIILEPESANLPNEYAVIFLPADVSKAKANAGKTIGPFTISSTTGYARTPGDATCVVKYLGSGTTFISYPYYPWGNDNFVGSVVGHDTINYAIGIRCKVV